MSHFGVWTPPIGGRRLMLVCAATRRAPGVVLHLEKARTGPAGIRPCYPAEGRLRQRGPPTPGMWGKPFGCTLVTCCSGLRYSSGVLGAGELEKCLNRCGREVWHRFTSVVDHGGQGVHGQCG